MRLPTSASSNVRAQKMMRTLFLAGAAFTLASCREGADEACDRGYEDGYEEGQYIVCREVDRMALGLKAQLRSCQGF